MSESPAVSAELVRKVASLARLRISDEELSTLTRQLARIVSYIDQLKEIPEEAFRTLDPPVDTTPLRPDNPVLGRGEKALAENSSRLAHGHGVVPRVVGG